MKVIRSDQFTAIKVLRKSYQALTMQNGVAVALMPRTFTEVEMKRR